MATLVNSNYANVVNYDYAELSLVASDYVVESLRTTYTTSTPTRVTYANTVGYDLVEMTPLSSDLVEGYRTTISNSTLGVLDIYNSLLSYPTGATANVLGVNNADILAGSNVRSVFGNVAFITTVYSRGISIYSTYLNTSMTFAVSTNGAPFVRNTVGPQFWNLG